MSTGSLENDLFKKMKVIELQIGSSIIEHIQSQLILDEFNIIRLRD